MSLLQKFAPADYDPTIPGDRPKIIDRQLLTELEFAYVTLAYYTQTDAYEMVDFKPIKLKDIRTEMLDGSGNYKDYSKHYVRLGDPNPAENDDITFAVIDHTEPDPLPPTTTKAYFTVALFISILEHYKAKITDDTDFEFSWGKRLNKADGRLYSTLIFRVLIGGSMKFFDYSSEDPKKILEPMEGSLN